MFQERLDCLREAGKILYDVSIHSIHTCAIICPFLIWDISLISSPQKYRCSFTSCIEEANGSAAVLVNLIADNFPCFRDRTRFEGKEVRFYKRAQILVADLWACFRGKSYGKFHDIDKLTMFAGMLICVYMSFLFYISIFHIIFILMVMLLFKTTESPKCYTPSAACSIPHR